MCSCCLNKQFLLVISVALVFTHAVSGTKVQYVTPSTGAHSQNESTDTLTLSMLAANTSDLLDANTTLIFLQGNHTLETDLVLTNLNNLLIQTTNASVTASITCSSRVSLKFINISQLNISGLEFNSCSSTIELVDQVSLMNSSFHEGSNSSALQLIQTNTNIVRSSFKSSIVGSWSNLSLPVYTFNYYGQITDLSYHFYTARVGGALVITSSNVEISSSYFDRNQAEVGGAIYSQTGSNITIDNCTFVNNKASCSNKVCYGGVLFIGRGCTAITNNSTFLNNTSEYSGGAMALFQGYLLGCQNDFSGNQAQHIGGTIVATSASTLVLVKSNISNSIAGENGGALFVDRGLLTINRSSFDKNEAIMRSGGVIYASHQIGITVHNSFFDNNKASRDGGVAYAYFSNITVHNSFFDKNEASLDGGVVYASSSSITVYNSSFDNNNASRWGGVVLAFVSSSITAHNSFFDNNEASLRGGVAYASCSSITVHNSSFGNNEVRLDGGVVFASTSSITVHNSSFNNNKASRGGVLDAAHQSNITVHNSSFDKNEVRLDGGVVYAPSSNIIVHNSIFNYNMARTGGVVSTLYSTSITMHNSSFKNNEARQDGGVVYATFQSSITVHNSSFDNNEAHGSGGVVYAEHLAYLNVNSSCFNNNMASSYGGVIYSGSSYIITVNFSLFVNSETGLDGGVLYVVSGKITVHNSCFYNNCAGNFGGVVHGKSIISISLYNSSFESNKANYSGGVMNAQSAKITAHDTSFVNNEALCDGGVVYVSNSSITVHNSSFDNNKARQGGVLDAAHQSNITVHNSSFDNNEARLDGGVVHIRDNGNVNFYNSRFKNNKAGSEGGVLVTSSSLVHLHTSYFSSNTAGARGGVIFKVETELTTIFITSEDGMIVNTCMFVNNSAIEGGVIALNEAGIKVIASEFKNNTAEQLGGVLSIFHRLSQKQITFVMSDFYSNKANRGGAIALIASVTMFTGDNCAFIGNQAQHGGVVHASESTVHLLSQSLLMANNTATENGGALHLSSTTLSISSDNSTFLGNLANDGGAIYASESTLGVEVYSQTLVHANTAKNNGGGLHLKMSELKIKGDNESIIMSRNGAKKNGGGLHADKSGITFEGTVQFINNEAENGAGIGLEKNAVLRGISAENVGIIDFVSNRASRHGGALYVDDKTLPVTCAMIENECFSKLLSFNFSSNSAGESGSNLFGGLLNRCKVHNYSGLFTDIESENITQGLANFLRSSNVKDSQLDTISSLPIQLCFCREGSPDCNYQPDTTEVNRGGTFSLEIIAYNQIGSPSNSTVRCSLNSSIGSLGEGQDTQSINEHCSMVNFTLFSPHNSTQLKLSTEGPCSEQNVTIEITCKCPIGFQMSQINDLSCNCICARVLQSYVTTQCDYTTQTIIRKDSFWIAYINYSQPSGYIIHPYCPYDYCHPPEENVHINLNIPEGADTQCASHRSGTLCGSCKPGFSVSLGSSACLHCPHYWPGLMVSIIIVFILSGIGLVALILVLNLTVAIGTLNAIIFYANIVAANRSVLFSTSKVSFASVFILWLNFDLGFETCFFNSMDTYTKTWIQLAFPAYIFLLVAVIIRLSYRFKFFGNLIGKKDPVATLATLILLSYAKLLQTILTAFSSATLVYPDKSKVSVWLPDATVGYLTAKHAVLFTAAIFILLAGLIYTFLLFTWQWFLRCPRKRVKWITNQKVSSFFGTYHIPYTPKHRYWTGLLLLVRVIVYLVSAFNPSGDPRITLLSTAVIMTCLYLYMTMFSVKLYKTWPINAMESVTYFNITTVSIITWHTLDSNKYQSIITNISVAVTFIQLLLVICYHAARYVNQKIYTKLSNTTVYKEGMKRLTPQKRRKVQFRHAPLPADNDIHQFHELLDMIDHPVNTNDYKIPQVCNEDKPAEPTKSVVEPPKPLLEQPPPRLEEIKEEDEQEQQLNGEDCITVEGHSMIINEKKRVNDASGIEIQECDSCPSSSVNELPKPYLGSLTSSEETNENVEYKKKSSEENGIMTVEESHTKLINERKQNIDSYSGIDMSLCFDDDYPSSSSENEMECDKNNITSKPHDENKIEVIVEVHTDSQRSEDSIDATVTDPTDCKGPQQLLPSDQPQ